MKDVDTLLKERLAQLLQRRGLSGREFARRLGVSHASVAGWLTGIVTLQVATLTRICRQFNVPIGYFFSAEDDEVEGNTADEDQVEVEGDPAE